MSLIQAIWQEVTYFCYSCQKHTKPNRRGHCSECGADYTD